MCRGVYLSGPLDSEVLQLIREGLETLSLSMAVSNTILDTNHTTGNWKHFIIDISSVYIISNYTLYDQRNIEMVCQFLWAGLAEVNQTLID